MMKKIILSILVLSMLAMNACKKEEEPAQQLNHYPSGKLPSSIVRLGGLYHVSGVNLFVINDYSFETMIEDFSGTLNYGCTQVRKGNYVLRNLDWLQLDEATNIIRIGATDEHLASLQVCGTDERLTHTDPINNLSKEMINSMLAYTTDGINSEGVYIGSNMAPLGEMSTTGGSGAINYTAPAGSVNADKPALSILYLPRLILDHATSLENAKEIIRGTSWTDSPSLSEHGYQMHWLIATEDASCVCEFIDGRPIFIDAASTTSPDYGNIVTNFSNHLMQQETVTSHGTGYERYELLKSEYPAAEGMEGMKQMACSVFFSKAYTMPLSDPYYFWTDWACDQIPAQTAMSWVDESNRTGAAWDYFKTMYQRSLSTYDWRTLGYDHYGSDFRGTWFTAHTSIWNLEDKSLVLDVEEQNLFSIGVTFAGGRMSE